MTAPVHATAEATAASSSKVTNAEPSYARASWARFRRARTAATAPCFFMAAAMDASMASLPSSVAKPEQWTVVALLGSSSGHGYTRLSFVPSSLRTTASLSASAALTTSTSVV